MFVPRNTLQVVCSPQCAIERAGNPGARAYKAKVVRAEIREAKGKLKTRREWLRDAQRVFNEYIRERDRDQCCISCGLPPGEGAYLTGSKWDCGHYRSVGACPELRYDEENAHRQCVKCNRYLSGNAVEYRAGLLHRIGPDRLARVEGPNAPVNYSVADLQELVKKFKDKTQALKRARGDYE